MGARLLGLVIAGALLSVGCEQVTSASDAESEAEQLPEIVPNLPEVPTLPPPPFPTTYEDDSYSVYGLRTRLTKVLDTDFKSGQLREIHRRVGATILFESSGGQVDKVAHLPELRFALGEPGMDTTSIDNAAWGLDAKTFFIHRVGSDGFKLYHKAKIEKAGGSVETSDQ